MENLLHQLKLGAVPYITVKDLEDKIRDRVLPKLNASFYRTCFETIINETLGLVIVTGGAAAACHVNDPNETNLNLKCLDVDYYGDNINLSNIQVGLQNAVHDVKNVLDIYIQNVKVMDPLIVFKPFQNAAFRLSDYITMNVEPKVYCVQSKYNNDDFDLIRFAIRVNIIANNKQDYNNETIVFSKHPNIPLNLFFMNIRIMKREFNGERCVKLLRWFGDSYFVVVPTLQKTLNNEIMCLMKDVFTHKFDYKIERRCSRIKKLFSKLPINCYYNCINDSSFLKDKNFDDICTFVKKLLDANGPALGCRKLLNLYLNTNLFVNILPHWVANQINYPHNCVSENWSKFISCVNQFIN
ncbi:hypothetical protein [Parapoynx stagnalis nucleopolyhedrovirus]|uniref:Ac18 n=1 Tax=Parapoynx stagnalis nucleopolyhedrovirus TaxID=2993413 RepID=A0A9E8BWI8_9ABAC|nr:hypothetical protein [Parapoynx stagnalis nucleopolyhedrovirus]